jgi:hypothetical protein
MAVVFRKAPTYVVNAVKIRKNVHPHNVNTVALIGK